MTNSNNSRTIALVVIIVVLALFAFRSVFFLLPFGVLPGIAHSAGEAGSIRGFLHGFGPFGRLAFFLLPAAFIILWGAVLIWVYGDAEKRGMSGILWLLLVLIGNVIGLLIYAIVRSETPVKRPAQGTNAAAAAACCPAETCGGCGKALSPGFEFCPYCGKSLKETCPACGKPVQEDWKVCPVCGTSTDPGAIRQG
jgi:RNA polymerase subunit RPABC4/transcription elongation factor Spt4